MKVVAAFAVLVFTMVISGQVYSQEEYTRIEGLDPLVRNFGGMGHSGSKCVYCHAFLMPDKEYEEKFLQAGCRCHQSDVANGYDVRMNDVREKHSSNTCKLCHAGTKNVTRQIYHQKVHRAVPCVKCHRIQNVTDFSVSKPASMECKTCHRYDIHYTHSEVLGNVCKMCHGTGFASRFTEKDLEKLNLGEDVINRTIAQREPPKQEVKKFGFITISRILAFIIDALF
ncbi:hypothetical protein [Candidatus Pyrohabitans sp.]